MSNYYLYVTAAIICFKATCFLVAIFYVPRNFFVIRMLQRKWSKNPRQGETKSLANEKQGLDKVNKSIIYNSSLCNNCCILLAFNFRAEYVKTCESYNHCMQKFYRRIIQSLYSLLLWLLFINRNRFESNKTKDIVFLLSIPMYWYDS